MPALANYRHEVFCLEVTGGMPPKLAYWEAICAAATSCQGFCRSELSMFRDLLGPEADVERTEHLLQGARRCAYLIRPRNSL